MVSSSEHWPCGGQGWATPPCFIQAQRLRMKVYPWGTPGSVEATEGCRGAPGEETKSIEIRVSF